MDSQVSSCLDGLDAGRTPFIGVWCCVVFSSDCGMFSSAPPCCVCTELVRSVSHWLQAGEEIEQEPAVPFWCAFSSAGRAQLASVAFSCYFRALFSRAIPVHRHGGAAADPPDPARPAGDLHKALMRRYNDDASDEFDWTRMGHDVSVFFTCAPRVLCLPPSLASRQPICVHARHWRPCCARKTRTHARANTCPTLVPPG